MDLNNYLDIWGYMSNDLFGDLYIFMACLIIIFIYYAIRTNIPAEIHKYMILLLLIIIFAKTQIILLWALILLASGFMFYYYINQLFNR